MNIQSFDFNSGGYRLFGSYHSPRAEVDRDCGVVICHPIGHEYIHCYRAMKQLAVRLALAGFPVIQFDYFGSGNSDGEYIKATRDKWIDDIAAAIKKLLSQSGLKRVSLIGLRFGATLAAIYSTRNYGVDKIVLWDTVICGKTYLSELKDQHADCLERYHCAGNEADDKAREHGFTEILGFPYSNGMMDEIDQFQFIGDIQGKLSRRVLLVDSCQKLVNFQVEKYLKSFDINVDYKQVSDPKIWLAEPYKALVPQQAIHTIISWMSENNH